MSLVSRKAGALVVVALAFFTDMVLYYLVVPLLPHYARELSLSQMEVGVLFGSYAVALLLSTFPLGRLADRVGRRPPLLWGLVGLGATTLLFALATSYPLLVLARVLQGISAAATWTSGLALLADTFPASERGRGMGTAFAFANLGVLLGPPIAGHLSDRLGPRAPFLLAAGLALLDAAARVLLLRDEVKPEGTRLGYRALVGNAVVRVFSGAMALGAGLFALLESTLPLHLDASFRMSASEIGNVFAVVAATHMVTSPLMGRLSDRVGRRKVLAAGLLMALVLVPLTGFLTARWAVVAAMAGLGVTASFVLSPASPALADAVEAMGSQSYASVFTLLNVAYSVGMILGPLLGSAAVTVFGVRGAFLASGLVFGAYLFALPAVPSAPPRR